MHLLNQHLKAIQSTRAKYNEILNSEKDPVRRDEITQYIMECNRLEKEILLELNTGDE